MSSPHIVYVVQQFPPEVGAGSARASEMALRWLAAGSAVTVVTAMPNRPQGEIYADYRGKLFDEREWNGIRVLRSWLFARPSAGSLSTLANNASFAATGFAHALMKVRDADVLIASSPPFLCLLAGTALARFRRYPLVVEVRDLWPDYMVDMGLVRRDSWPAKLLFGLERWSLAAAARVAVVTESFEARLAEKGAPASQIHVLPNGVDLERYYRVQEPPVLQGFEPTTDLTLGYIGNFGRGQDLLTVVDAARRCLEAELPVRFVLAGDGPERQKVARAAEDLPREAVLLLPTVSKQATLAFYNLCDACLVPLAPLPILRDTVPSKLFEIMACERPVLASVAGEAADIVRQAGSGIVSAPGSASELVEAIERLLAMSPAERMAMGRRGREFVARRYDRARIADEYLDLLKEVMSDPSIPVREAG